MALTKIDDRGLKTPIDLLDNEKIRLGTGNDIELYHDGTDSFLSNSTGGLKVLGDTIRLKGKSVDENMVVASANGSVELYHNNSKKFETSSDGVIITSADDSDCRVKGDFKFCAADGTLEAMFDASTAQLEFLDNSKATFGTGDDLSIYHNGTNSYLTNTTGVLFLQSDGGVQIKDTGGNEVHLKTVDNGAVELYHNNSKMIETDANGVKVGDGLRYIVGDDADGYLRYTSNTVEIYVAHAQPFKINLGSETALLATANAGVALYYNNSKKFETTNAGGTLTGTWTGAGKILQVVQAVKTDVMSSSTNNSFVDITGLSVSITPSSSSNKILVIYDINAGHSGTGNVSGFRLMRDSTAIGIGDASSSRGRWTNASMTFHSNTNNTTKSVGMTFLDSPSTTSSTTYKVQFYNAANTIYINRDGEDIDAAGHGRGISTITVMEVSA